MRYIFKTYIFHRKFKCPYKITLAPVEVRRVAIGVTGGPYIFHFNTTARNANVQFFHYFSLHKKGGKCDSYD